MNTVVDDRLASENVMVFSGNANPELSQAIATRLNLQLGKASVGKFSDGEVMVEVIDSVRGKDVFIVQPTCNPANDNLMELLVMVDAIRRASAARITAVIPYFGYSRQDRRPRSVRVPITAKMVADMIDIAGVDRDVEEALDLVGVQVDGQHAVDAHRADHVGDHLGRDRHAHRARAAVLARVAEIRDQCHDAARRCAAAGIGHDEQLHQMVVCRRGCRLHEEHVVAAHVFHDLDADLAVAEATDVDASVRQMCEKWRRLRRQSAR